MKQKSKPGIAGIHDDQNLFRAAAVRRHRTLILPRYLEEASFHIRNRADEIAAAHQIFLRWADLESNHQLAGNETTLDDSFRQEIFATALGYSSSTMSPASFYYQKGFHVPGSGPPDGVLGNFPPVSASSIRACLELKNASTDLDHDKFNGRTPVQQCWDYLNNLPDCPWGIVSNFVSFRLYHRDKTQQAFEHFELQKLRDPDTFARFYVLFERGGLLANHIVKVSRAEELLRRTDTRQREVGDELYNYYSDQRAELIDELVANHRLSRDQAFRAAQKLLDRIIFIAFCEDRGLLPDKLLENTWKSVPPLHRVTNPRWRNFLDTFHAIDKGHENLDLKEGYNGGLFRHDPLVDELELSDKRTEFFKNIGAYDFADDINVDVLGHVFEKSVSEIEKARHAQEFFKDANTSVPAMPKSAERKRFGIYYTPPEFTRFIVASTLGALITERFAALAAKHNIDADQSMRTPPSEQFATYWQDCLDAMRQIAVIDPACGSGAFLIAAYELLEDQYQNVAENLARHTGKPVSTWSGAIPEYILNENLHGVDLSPEAAEITQLALWLRSRAQRPPSRRPL